MRRFILWLTTLAVVAVLSFLSGFLRGRGAADSVARAQSPRFVRTGSHLVRHPQYSVPVWVFSYEDEHIVTIPCTVFVSLIGGVISQQACER
jgi:hypothetical protein